MNFAKFQQEDRRLSLLLALDNAAQYKANHYLLLRYLGSVGHSVSHDTLRTELQWLAEQGLVTLANSSDDIVVATLTTRGMDVANARTLVPGVSRPQPGQD